MQEEICVSENMKNSDNKYFCGITWKYKLSSVRNLLQFVNMNGHTIAMGLFKKDTKKGIDKETEKMLKKMGKEAEEKVRMVSLVYEGKGSFYHSPTFSLGIRSPLVAAVVEEAVQVK